MSCSVRVLESHHRTGLIHRVDSLVWKASVGDVSFRHPHTSLYGFICIDHVVMLLVVCLQPVQDGDRLSDVCVLHYNLLESSVQRSVLFYCLAEFVHRCGSDTLDVSSGKRRFEHVCGVKTAGCSASSNDCMELVNEKDDVRICGNFVDDGFEPLLKVSAVFCACNY